MYGLASEGVEEDSKLTSAVQRGVGGPEEEGERCGAELLGNRGANKGSDRRQGKCVLHGGWVVVSVF
jgi:hypothetical protein